LIVAAVSMAVLALAFAGGAAARDQATACRALSVRGKVWSDCCRQSYARNPSRVISRRTRLRQIDRCVRIRQRRG
jgi:hypothetical protein